MDLYPKVCVIMPIYNVERYLRKALDCAVHQQYHNLEVICINDGSTDKSGEILEEYGMRDARIRAIQRGVNKGYTYTLNEGLNHLPKDCEYVAFLDPDDWQELDYYSNAVRALQETGADIFISNFYKNYPDHKQERRVEEDSLGLQILSPKETLLHMYKREGYFAACVCAFWNKVFKSKFFMPKPYGFGLRIDAKNKLGGDTTVTTECVSLSQSIVYDGNPYYHYFFRQGSLVNSDYDRKLSFLQAILKNRELIISKNFSLETLPYIQKYYAYHAYLLGVQARDDQNFTMLKFAQREMKRYEGDYMSTNIDYPNRMEQFQKLLNMKTS